MAAPGLVETAAVIKSILQKPDKLTIEDEDSIMSYLRSIGPLSQYLANFTAKTNSLLCRSMKLIDMPADQIIFNKGDLSDMFYITLQGDCIAYIKEEDNREIHINRLGVGRSFGERGLIKNLPRMLSFKTGTAATLIGISKKAFTRVLSDSVRRIENQKRKFCLENIPLLKYKNKAVQDRVIFTMQLISYWKGERIVRHRERFGKILFVKQGEILIKRDGQEVSRLGHGASAWEECGLHGSPSEFEVTSIADNTEIYTIDKDEILHSLPHDCTQKMEQNYKVKLICRSRAVIPNIRSPPKFPKLFKASHPMASTTALKSFMNHTRRSTRIGINIDTSANQAIKNQLKTFRAYDNDKPWDLHLTKMPKSFSTDRIRRVPSIMTPSSSATTRFDYFSKVGSSTRLNTASIRNQIIMQKLKAENLNLKRQVQQLRHSFSSILRTQSTQEGQTTRRKIRRKITKRDVSYRSSSEESVPKSRPSQGDVSSRLDEQVSRLGKNMKVVRSSKSKIPKHLAQDFQALRSSIARVNRGISQSIIRKPPKTKRAPSQSTSELNKRLEALKLENQYLRGVSPLWPKPKPNKYQSVASSPKKHLTAASSPKRYQTQTSSPTGHHCKVCDVLLHNGYSSKQCAIHTNNKKVNNV